jgi:hypothetical protein
MSADQGHGVEVEIDSIRTVLGPTRTLRLTQFEHKYIT